MQKLYAAYVAPHLMTWDGVWPGVRECREYNLWCKLTDKGWMKCGVDDPDATEDINELLSRAKWDKEKKRYVI